jgi:hypothetical protein
VPDVLQIFPNLILLTILAGSIVISILQMGRLRIRSHQRWNSNSNLTPNLSPELTFTQIAKQKQAKKHFTKSTKLPKLTLAGIYN